MMSLPVVLAMLPKRCSAKKLQRADSRAPINSWRRVVNNRVRDRAAMLNAPKDRSDFKVIAPAMKIASVPMVISTPSCSKTRRTFSTSGAAEPAAPGSSRAMAGTIAPIPKASARPAMIRHRITVTGRDPGAVKNRRKARAAAERLRDPEARDSGWFFMAPLANAGNQGQQQGNSRHGQETQQSRRRELRNREFSVVFR